MDTTEFLSAIRSDTAALAAAATGNLDRRVPACPEWDMADLVWHVHGVQLNKAWIVREQPADPSAFDLERPANEDLVASLVRGADELIETLSARDQTAHAWTWFEPAQTVGFWTRRMAQETVVHRWDGEQAAGAPNPIEPRLAADGIDEMLTVHMAMEPPLKGSGETIHLHATDADADWLVTHTPDRTVMEQRHAKGDAGARGSASDLLLTLWGRKPATQLELFGDRALWERFLDWPDLS